MKKLFKILPYFLSVALLVSGSAFLFGPKAQAGYTYVRSIVLQSSKIPANQSNFTVLVCANGGTPCNTAVSGLNQSGGGAHVQNSNGYDITFWTNSDCTGAMNWEMEKYTASTGEMYAWVLVTSLSTSGNTFYMCYGNSAISSFQGGAAGTAWNSNYTGVWHLPNGTSLTANDSTSGGIGNGTVTAATPVTGKIDGGADFVAANTAQIDFGSPNLSYTAFTASEWMKASSVVGTVFTQWADAGGGQAFILDHQGGTGKARALVNSGTDYPVNGTTNVADGAWHYLSMTWSASGNVEKLYVDGVQEGGNTTTTGANIQNASVLSHLWAGRYTDTAYYTGDLDELRISNTARSADWVTTEYNNQSAPSTFEIFGNESALGLVTPHTYVDILPGSNTTILPKANVTITSNN